MEDVDVYSKTFPTSKNCQYNDLRDRTQQALLGRTVTQASSRTGMSTGYSAPLSTVSSFEAQQDSTSHVMAPNLSRFLKCLSYPRQADSIPAHLSEKAIHSAVMPPHLKCRRLIV